MSEDEDIVIGLMVMKHGDHVYSLPRYMQLIGETRQVETELPLADSPNRVIISLLYLGIWRLIGEMR